MSTSRNIHSQFVLIEEEQSSTCHVSCGMSCHGDDDDDDKDNDDDDNYDGGDDACGGAGDEMSFVMLNANPTFHA